MCIRDSSKVACRNERRDSMKSIEQAGSEQKLSDDQVSGSKDDVDVETKKHTAQIEELIAKKITEIEDV